MKKIIRIIMALTFVFGLVGITAQASTSDAALTLSYTGSAKVGETITLNINLSDKANLSTLMFNLSYPGDKLELLELEENQKVISGISEVNKTAKGKVSVSALTLDSWNTGGVAFTAKFKILKAGAEVNFEITEACLGDFDGTDVTQSVSANSDKKITFSEKSGSVNGETKSDEEQLDKTETGVQGSDGKNTLAEFHKTTTEGNEVSDTSVFESHRSNSTDFSEIITFVIVVSVLVALAVAIYIIIRKKKVL